MSSGPINHNLMAYVWMNSVGKNDEATLCPSSGKPWKLTVTSPGPSPYFPLPPSTTYGFYPRILVRRGPKTPKIIRRRPRHSQRAPHIPPSPTQSASLPPRLLLPLPLLIQDRMALHGIAAFGNGTTPDTESRNNSFNRFGTRWMRTRCSLSSCLACVIIVIFLILRLAFIWRKIPIAIGHSTEHVT